MRNYGYLKGSEFPTVITNSLDIDCPNILGQRHCSEQEIDNALASRNGYDRGLYRPVFGVAIKKEVARAWVEQQPPRERAQYDASFKHDIHEFKDWAVFLFDGKHRGRQLKRVDPLIRYFPIALIYKVDSVEQGNWYFNQFNERSLTKVKPEAIFINDLFAGCSETKRLVTTLSRVKLAICDTNDWMVVPTAAKSDISIPSIGANPWKLLNSTDWHPDFKFVEQAVEIYHEMLAESSWYQYELTATNDAGEPTFKRFAVNSWLLHGLAMLFRHRPLLLDKPQPREAFVKSLARSFDYYKGKQAKMLTGLKTDAIGKGINKEALDINSSQVYAVAIAALFNENATLYGMKQRAVLEISKVGTLYDDIQADLDERADQRRIAKLRKAS